MSTSPLDASIPMLTEIITVPQQHNTPTALPDDMRSSPFERIEPDLFDSIGIPDKQKEKEEEAEEERWRQLEKTVRERVLFQVLEMIDPIIQQRLREGLADLLQTMTEGLAAEIRDDLRLAVEEAVPRITSEETSFARDFQK